MELVRSVLFAYLHKTKAAQLLRKQQHAIIRTKSREDASRTHARISLFLTPQKFPPFITLSATIFSLFILQLFSFLHGECFQHSQCSLSVISLAVLWVLFSSQTFYFCKRSFIVELVCFNKALIETFGNTQQVAADVVECLL